MIILVTRNTPKPISEIDIANERIKVIENQVTSLSKTTSMIDSTLKYFMFESNDEEATQ